jgi:hypothetical protein
MPKEKETPRGATYYLGNGHTKLINNIQRPKFKKQRKRKNKIMHSQAYTKTEAF